MILNEVTIPDDIFRQYGSVEAIQTRLEETAGMDLEAKDWKFQLSSRDLSNLRHHFGPFLDAADLVKRIINVGSVKVQEEKYQMSADQIQNLKTQAYFWAGTGEPSSEKEAIEAGFPKDGQKKIVQRYLERILDEAMDVVLGNF